jgi:hypothetical protein
MKEIKITRRNKVKTLREVRAEYLQAVLKSVKGCTKLAAELSGLSERTVRDFKKGLN